MTQKMWLELTRWKISAIQFTDSRLSSFTGVIRLSDAVLTPIPGSAKVVS